MESFKRILTAFFVVVYLVGCASTPSDDDSSIDSPEVGSEAAESDMPVADEDLEAEATPKKQAEAPSDDLDLDEAPAADAAPPQEQAKSEAPADDFDLDAKPQETAQEKPAENPPAQDPLSEAPVETAQTPPPPEPMAPAPVENVPPPVTNENPPAVVDNAPPPSSNGDLAKITDIQFRPNETGGTIIVSADRPVTFQTRRNDSTNQFVVEVANASLPQKLTRTLNTKDIQGLIGAVDAYQGPNPSTATIVIQMRQGASEPAVSNEGNNLLIAASSGGGGAVAQSSPGEVPDAGGGGGDAGMSSGGSSGGNTEILGSQTLVDFLLNNNRYYGRKISLDFNNMEVKEALKFISDESGVNMIITDTVKGNVNLKLKEVPWDQALVMIMKSKGLGYSKEGNILRIAPIEELKNEENEAIKLQAAKTQIQELVVKMFTLSFAKADELEPKLKGFLTEKGKAVSDPRINAIVVTDVPDSITRVGKLLNSLDVQPPQVLIEGKIVEATESFTRSVGVNWGVSGAAKNIGNSPAGPLNITPSLNINNGMLPGRNLNFNVNVGVIDILGNVSALLALSEAENLVKVVSSPRIMTVTNEKSSINQSTQVPIRNTTTANGIQTTTIEFKTLNLKLEVLPQVTVDGSVMMAVDVQREFVGDTDVNTGAFAINSRAAKTKVLVKNGQTAVIGGIYRSDANSAEEGVPFLRSIPIFGALFQQKTYRKEKSELMIFLTPRVMSQAEGFNTTSN